MKSVNRAPNVFTAARDQILQNRKMVELDCSMDLPVDLDQLRIAPDYPALLKTLEDCEFKSLIQEVQDEASKAGNVPGPHAETKSAGCSIPGRSRKSLPVDYLTASTPASA